MSNNESFIDEVNEQVQQDKLFGYLRKYGWIGVLLVLILVGGASYREYALAQSRGAAENFGDSVLGAMNLDDTDARIAALNEVQAEGATVAVADMILASQLQEAGQNVEAADVLNRIAANGDVDPIYRDIAQFKAILLAGPDLSPADRKAALEPLAAAGGSMRLLAMEQIVIADIDAQDIPAALTGLDAILEDAQLGRNLRQRAEAMVVSLGGTLAGEADTQ